MINSNNNKNNNKVVMEQKYRELCKPYNNLFKSTCEDKNAPVDIEYCHLIQKLMSNCNHFIKSKQTKYE